MAITLRGTPQKLGFATASSGYSLTFDVAPLEGDVVLVFGGYAAGNTTIAAPGSGYTEIIKNETTEPIGGCWYKVMGATPDTDVSLPGPGAVNHSSGFASYVLSGVDAAVLDQIAVSVAGANPDPITTQTDGAWVFAVVTSDINDATVPAPAGYSGATRSGSNTSDDFTMAAAYKEVAVAGSEDPGNFGLGGTLISYTIAIKPGASAFAGSTAGDGGHIWPPRSNDPRWAQLITDSGITATGNFIDDVHTALEAMASTTGQMDDLWAKVLAANSVTDTSEPFSY